MNTEGQIEDFPFDIEYDVGEIILSMKEAPGVYYISSRKENQQSSSQYYIIDKATPIISLSAKKYGKTLKGHNGLLLYNIEDVAAGQKIVEYEIARYKLKNNDPEVTQEALSDIASTGMETNPEFFGHFPVPAQTPLGKMIRYKTLSNGIFWIETVRLKTILAVCDVFEDQLYEQTAQNALRLEDEELVCGFSYLFYPYEISCIPLFELLPSHQEWIHTQVINKPALMNAIWEYTPEYATAYNTNEVMGLHDGIGNLLQSLGHSLTLNSSMEHTILVTPGAGTNFCALFE